MTKHFSNFGTVTTKFRQLDIFSTVKYLQEREELEEQLQDQRLVISKG